VTAVSNLSMVARCPRQAAACPVGRQRRAAAAASAAAGAAAVAAGAAVYPDG